LCLSVCMKVLIVLNTVWNVVNFREGLVRALLASGYDVLVAAPPDGYVTRLLKLGCRYVPLNMDNQGTHPGRDLLLLFRVIRLFSLEKPDLFLGYTVKPNVYGSLVAHLFGVPVVNNVAGLGSVFIDNNYVTSLVRLLYRLAFFRSRKVFFQNEEDRQHFINNGLVQSGVTDRLPGSGIDLENFFFQPSLLREKSGKFRFLLIARMLWDKGVAEFVEAARLIRERWPEAECCLLGFVDVPSPSSISLSQINEWVAEGSVLYLGERDDVRSEIAMADCIVLPSFYREGVPHSLLEAAAIGRPLITTDTDGCRDAVEEGKNGFLCKPRDARDLAEKMERMLLLSDEERHAMALYGRKKMEQEFDEKIVIQKYLEVIDSIN
jgi:glycosyltransferase involved in cell wall biosynthesis